MSDASRMCRPAALEPSLRGGGPRPRNPPHRRPTTPNSVSELMRMRWERMEWMNARCARSAQRQRTAGHCRCLTARRRRPKEDEWDGLEGHDMRVGVNGNETKTGLVRVWPHILRVFRRARYIWTNTANFPNTLIFGLVLRASYCTFLSAAQQKNPS